MKESVCRLPPPSLLNPSERVSDNVPDRKPMNAAEERRQNKRSEVGSLMPVIPYVGPPVAKAGEKSELSFKIEGPGKGRSVDDKEEKIGEHSLAFGAGVAIEKHQE